MWLTYTCSCFPLCISPASTIRSLLFSAEECTCTSEPHLSIALNHTYYLYVQPLRPAFTWLSHRSAEHKFSCNLVFAEACEQLGTSCKKRRQNRVQPRVPLNWRTSPQRKSIFPFLCFEWNVSSSRGCEPGHRLAGSDLSARLPTGTVTTMNCSLVSKWTFSMLVYSYCAKHKHKRAQQARQTRQPLLSTSAEGWVSKGRKKTSRLI